MYTQAKNTTSKRIRIVVVEDDDAFREIVVLSLLNRGYQARGVHDSAALYRDLLERPADIVVLDVELSGDNGFMIAQQLRTMQRTRLLGIIMLTSHSDLQARVDGLESGADMFITKPANPREISASIDSLYRRLNLNVEVQGSTPWRFVRTEWKLIAPSGAEITLTHLETLLVDILAEGDGRPVSRRAIISTALKQDPLAYDERRLEAVISRLRRKIAKSYGSSQPIKVAHSVGYIFADPITRE
ncbi:response regulator transcription factor [Glaciimonas immobilis]|uniref:DNA-binding response OmpR family regulator n=1 Tax=Glaciimonas immobilis TaxID=728004 RepID=A0A840RRA3_9BURK|nr:response regulator transcription factor [Glaciimonas immobilis]KAF3998170.1 response regulator transcription factor [Glaciimonas immobilis]MBB5199120.1 DNA-binding response OmpR family regulator [Glaciimonas immobilis]